MRASAMELCLKMMIKNKFTSIFTLLLMYSAFLLCRAQERTLPLNKTLNDSIKAGDYLKDLDNDYKPFVGTWIAEYDDKIILIKIIKVSKRPARNGFREKEIKYFEDTLMLQHKITDKNGKVIENYIHPIPNISKMVSYGFSKTRGIAHFHYDGVKCGVGSGRVDLKMADNKHLLWNYFPQETFTDRCTQETDITVNLPEKENLIFIKK